VAQGTGTTGKAFPLTVSSSTMWVPGMLKAAGFSTTDMALNFDAASDVAYTGGPVVGTSVGYTIMAFVSPSTATGNATAVSQDGSQVSTFELGMINDSTCPTGTGACFAFSVASTDATSPAPVRAMSTVPVQAGKWYHIVGIRTADKVQVSVCALGDATQLNVNPQPVLSSGAAFSSTWNGNLPFFVGRGMAGGVAGHPWLGIVDNVQVMDGPASVSKLRTSCAQVE
jgi:hypothetical protein